MNLEDQTFWVISDLMNIELKIHIFCIKKKFVGQVSFDKVKNKGVWLQKGEAFDDGKIEIESFNPSTEVLKIKGGTTLSLKKSDGKVLSVPSAMPVNKPKPVKKNAPPPATGRKIVTSSGRTITIPPRNPLPLPKK